MLIVELIADCRVDLHFCARTPCLLSALGLEAPIPAGPKCRVAGLVGNSGRAQGGGLFGAGFLGASFLGAKNGPESEITGCHSKWVVARVKWGPRSVQ